MSPKFAATYEVSAETVGRVRDQLAAIARAWGLDPETVHGVRLAVSEAATNALVHGYRRRPGPLAIRAECNGRGIVICIRDHGGGCRPRTDSPGLGLGLPVMASVTERLEVSDEDPGTEVRMTFGRAG